MTAPTTAPATLTTVDALVQSKKESLMQIAVPDVRSNFDVWSKRAIVEVAQNKELNSWILSSKDAQFQFITKLSKACQVGLQLGGTRPHAYFMVMSEYKDGKKVGENLRMDITKDGLAHAIVHGNGAVLQSVPEIFRVYANDRFSIDQAGKSYTHEFSPFGDRGKLLGWFTVLHYRKTVNGQPWTEIPFVTLEKVEKIKNGYSQITSPAWKKSEDEMLDKIATKQLLKKPFAEAEGLAMLIEAEENEASLSLTPPMDITDRATAKVDKALGNLNGDFESDPVSEKPINEEPKKEKEKTNKDLF